ncbi:MAG: type 4a pilus biogenesis protein PilO [Patescibacteria group bacterium]
MNLNNLKETVVNFIVPIISLLVTVLLLLLGIFPSISKVPELEAEQTTTGDRATLLEAKVVKLEKLLDFKTTVEENSNLVSKVLISEPQIPELLTQITEVAEISGIKITRMGYSFGSVSPISSLDNAEFETVLVSLGVDSDFESAINFLENLENAARLVNTDVFRFSPSTSADSENLYEFTFTLSSQYLVVDSQAVTDSPIEVDVTDASFVTFMDKLKGLKFYEPTVDDTVDAEELTNAEVNEAATGASETSSTSGTTGTGTTPQ